MLLEAKSLPDQFCLAAAIGGNCGSFTDFSLPKAVSGPALVGIAAVGKSFQ